MQKTKTNNKWTKRQETTRQGRLKSQREDKQCGSVSYPLPYFPLFSSSTAKTLYTVHISS